MYLYSIVLREDDETVKALLSEIAIDKLEDFKAHTPCITRGDCTHCRCGILKAVLV